MGWRWPGRHLQEGPTLKFLLGMLEQHRRRRIQIISSGRLHRGLVWILLSESILTQCKERHPPLCTTNTNTGEWFAMFRSNLTSSVARTLMAVQLFKFPPRRRIELAEATQRASPQGCWLASFRSGWLSLI